VDLLETSTGKSTSLNFGLTGPIPKGFFCANSPAFTGTVSLQGVPLATLPAGVAGTADTLLERPVDAAFGNGVAKLPTLVRALSMVGTAPIAVACPGANAQWRVSACLCGTQPTNTLLAKVDTTACGGSCGSFNGQLQLNVCLRFTQLPAGPTLGPISRTIVLNVNNTPWCYRAGNGALAVTTAFKVDTDCDGVADLGVPPTSNFFAGWTCATLNSPQTCWQQYAALTHCHPNYTNPGAHDHCVNPVCGER
jgi:hypothetical protein